MYKLEYSDVVVCDQTLTDFEGTKLVLLSDSQCGYCQLAYRDISNSNLNALSTIIVDYDDKSDHNPEFTVINGNSCNEIEKPNFFPQVFLFSDDNKLIWKKKGWFKENISEIKNSNEKHQSS